MVGIRQHHYNEWISLQRTEPIWIKFWPIWILHNKQSLSWNNINKVTWTELTIEVVYFHVQWGGIELKYAGDDRERRKWKQVQDGEDRLRDGSRRRKEREEASPLQSIPTLWLVRLGETSILHCSGFLPHFVRVCVCVCVWAILNLILWALSSCVAAGVCVFLGR